MAHALAGAASRPMTVEDWTEERAIAALEENQQVMIPGLREQAQGHCHVKCSDFDLLCDVACRDATYLLQTPSLPT
jgi:hypothetical protein